MHTQKDLNSNCAVAFLRSYVQKEQATFLPLRRRPFYTRTNKNNSIFVALLRRCNKHKQYNRRCAVSLLRTHPNTSIAVASFGVAPAYANKHGHKNTGTHLDRHSTAHQKRTNKQICIRSSQLHCFVIIPSRHSTILQFIHSSILQFRCSTVPPTYKQHILAAISPIVTALVTNSTSSPPQPNKRGGCPVQSLSCPMSLCFPIGVHAFYLLTDT